MLRSNLVKSLYLTLFFCIFYTLPVVAQTIPEDQPFAPKVHKPQLLNYENVAVLITWVDANQNECWLLFKLNADKEVYFVARHSPQGMITFGYSREYLMSMSRMGAKFNKEGVIDLDKPFIIRDEGEKTTIFQEDAQAISNLFHTLNQFYKMSVWPSMQGSPQDFEGLSKISLRNPLTREYPHTWSWGKEKRSLLIA